MRFYRLYIYIYTIDFDTTGSLPSGQVLSVLPMVCLYWHKNCCLRATFDSRLSLRQGGRGPSHAGPSSNPRHGGVAPRERWAGLIRGWTAAGQAELGTPGINRATFDSRPPLRRRGRGSLRMGPLPNPRHGGVTPREGQPGLIRGWAG